MIVSIVIDSSNKIIRQGECLNKNHNPYSNGVLIETDIKSLVGNYKLVNGVLYELTEDEKQIDICPKQTVEEKVIILEKTIANLEIELLEIK